MRNVVHRWSAESGLSLLEVVIAVGLMSVATGFLGFLVTRPQRMIDAANTRLTEAAQADIALGAMGKQLAQSFVMKSGLLNCQGNTISALRAPQRPIVLDEAGERFTFAYSAHSSIAGISETSNTELSVMDAEKFPAGSVILLTHLTDPAFGGIFAVLDSDDTTDTIGVANGDGSAPDPINCSAVGATNKNISQLTTDPFHQVFNSSPTTFRIDRIHYVSYSLVASETVPGRFNLIVEQFPHPTTSGAGILNQLAMERVRSVTVEPGWIPDADTPGSGRVRISYTIRRDETTGGGRRERGADGVLREVAMERALAGEVLYPLGGSLRSNFGAPSLPSSPEPIYPSCALMGTPTNGVFQKNGATAEDSALGYVVRIDAFTSGLNGRFASIQASLQGTPPPTCWASNVANVIDTSGPAPRFQMAGATQSFAMSISAGGGYEPFYCEMPPGSQIDAHMSYYDDSLRRIVNKACSRVISPLTGTYRYVGTPTRCDAASGNITFGRLVDTVSEAPGPVLYVGNTSCVWSDNATPTSCQQANNGVLDPSRTLVRVRLMPPGLTIENASNEVVCN